LILNRIRLNGLNAHVQIYTLHVREHLETVGLKDEKRAIEIEKEAYKLLIDKGFKATSMLAVAKASKASNETLYRWYGDKLGLFSTMIQRNARTVETIIIKARSEGNGDVDALNGVGRALLAMVTGDNAIALNRAAAGDASGRLGLLLAKEGRSRIGPQIADMIHETFADTVDVRECVEVFISLLIGDLQIRRATGALGPMSDKELTTRADRAIAHLQVLYPIRINRVLR
jgi:AcrR family transcriptional regulator